MASYAATSPRLHLQTLSEDLHLYDMHAIQSNPQAMFWSSKKVSIDLEQTRTILRNSLPTVEQPWSERWAILLRCTPETLLSQTGGTDVSKWNPWESETGEVSAKELDQRKAGKLRMIGVIGIVREQEIGYRIHPDFWGKGFMSEALKMFIEMFWGMEINKNYDRLLAAADPENGASLRVLEKAGFVKAEYRKDYYERGALGGRKSDLQCFYLPRPSAS
ncbi:acyl-CoA N-acyltransferase [Hyaloscypha variabilis F]|uniref:Acyl-CoA N-acyltransferase n=1 Tax=Hyaloscypha variabilis (strain UAMH 11265 / GT02V1 / F) TaxID=1149755 RepID=A0A2J6R485_HYAVF|nr:acyl-CoA N-acyltransferase [Hyaloscypha variabilis F]